MCRPASLAQGQLAPARGGVGALSDVVFFKPCRIVPSQERPPPTRMLQIPIDCGRQAALQVSSRRITQVLRRFQRINGVSAIVAWAVANVRNQLGCRFSIEYW